MCILGQSHLSVQQCGVNVLLAASPRAATCQSVRRARQPANRSDASRDCAITRLPGGELHTRMEMIATVVQSTASGTVNCPNVSILHRDCALAGRDDQN